MRSLSRPAIAVTIGALLLGGETTVADESRRPNVVVILADDLGRELLSSYGGESYETPTLDRFAQQGMQFNTCYATPMCAPSRVELLTGRYSFRNYTAWEEFDTSQKTVAQLLKDGGYATAMAGKWHPFGHWDKAPLPPRLAGFDEFCSYDSRAMGEQAKRGQGNRYWGGNIVVNGTKKKLDRYGPDVYSDFLTDFIRRHRNEPFFVYYAMTLMHRPFQPTPDSEGAPRQGEAPPDAWLTNKGHPDNFAPMLRYADRTIAKVLAVLDELELADDTLVIVTADNGTDNVSDAKTIRSQFMGETVRGGKYFPTELGANVPFIARWPKRIPAGHTQEGLMDFTDILPTLCALADVDVPANYPLDGRNIAPLLFGEPDGGKPFVYTWGNFENNSSKYKAPASHPDALLDVVRNERWKRYSNGTLYDLSQDFLEKHPVEVGSSPAADSARRALEEAAATLRNSRPRKW